MVRHAGLWLVGTRPRTGRPHSTRASLQPPLTKRPLHLELRANDRAREVARLVQLGASVEERFATHTWIRDPQGNDFCVVDV
ncbi:MAG: VOC family protein [Acidimicrobiales bacterium]